MPRPPKPAGLKAEKILAVRLTPGDFALMGELVKRHQVELTELGVATQATPASLVRTLLLREAKRLGVSAPPAPPSPPAQPSPQPTPPEPKPTPAAKPSPKPAPKKPAPRKVVKRGKR